MHMIATQNFTHSVSENRFVCDSLLFEHHCEENGFIVEMVEADPNLFIRRT